MIEILGQSVSCIACLGLACDSSCVSYASREDKSLSCPRDYIIKPGGGERPTASAGISVTIWLTKKRANGRYSRYLKLSKIYVTRKLLIVSALTFWGEQRECSLNMAETGGELRKYVGVGLEGRTSLRRD